MAGSLEFRSKRLLLFLIYRSSRCFLPSFKSIGISVQDKKRKIDFQDGDHGGHLGFSIGSILTIFYLLLTAMLPTKFQVIGISVQEKKRKIDFSRCRHLGISDRNAFSYFDVQVTPKLPTSFKIISLCVKKKKRKIDFKMAILDFRSERLFIFLLSVKSFCLFIQEKKQWWRPRRPSWNSNRIDFNYFWSTIKVKKDCFWKQRTYKITKIGDSVWLSLFICNTVDSKLYSHLAPV